METGGPNGSNGDAANDSSVSAGAARTPRPVRPPRVALWLLARLLSSSGAEEPMVGDLIEQYADGRRPRAWFWRQAIGAIGVDAARQITHHRREALHGLEAGWLVLLGLLFFGTPLVGPSMGRLSFAIVDRLFFEIDGSTETRLLIIGLAAGLPSALWFWSISAMAGWCAGRVHRPQQASNVLLFAATVALIVGPLWIARAPGDAHIQALIQSGQGWRVRNLVITQAATLGFGLACLLSAGLWGAGRAASAPTPADDAPGNDAHSRS